jgi:hypothetical protein
MRLRSLFASAVATVGTMAGCNAILGVQALDDPLADASDGAENDTSQENASSNDSGDAERPESACPDAGKSCDGGCVDINNDDHNCGSCGFACSAGQRCTNGSCSCGPTTGCAGCCSSEQCTVPSFPTCGLAGGAQCATCGVESDHCSATGQCACADAGPCPKGKACAAGACTCNASSCPSGCCDGTGSCVSPGTAAACGANGKACLQCPFGQDCSSGACACSASLCNGAYVCNSAGQCQSLWSTVATTTLTSAYVKSFVAASGSNIYIGNSCCMSPTVQYFMSYSVATNTWANLPVSSALSAGGYLGVLIGTPSGLEFTGNTSAIFTNSGAWIAPPNESVGEPAVAALGSIVYLTGGRTSSGTSGAVLSYDVSTGTGGSWDSGWSPAPVSFGQGCGGADPATGTVYVFGGNPSIGHTYALSVSQNKWTMLPSTADTVANCFVANAPTWRGNLVYTEPYNAVNPALIEFSLSTLTWAKGPKLPSSSDPLTFVAVVTPSTGDLYLVGFTAASNTATIYKYSGP